VALASHAHGRIAGLADARSGLIRRDPPASSPAHGRWVCSLADGTSTQEDAVITNFRLFACVALVSALAACADTHDAVTHEDGVAAGPQPWQSEFSVDRTDLVSRGTNPFFVLEPGYRLVFKGQEKHKDVDLVITVLDQTEMVDGVETRIVEERESAGGELVEVSRNFFAISTRTHDVFYFGEDVDMYSHGKVDSHEGSWRSGAHGARFGLMMPGVPQVGMRYQAEVAPHVAMDRCEIVSLQESISTPAGSFDHCLKVEETTPIEPDDKEYKVYARGIGLVQDGSLRLASHGPWN
jgi:hypothetical protein